MLAVSLWTFENCSSTGTHIHTRRGADRCRNSCSLGIIKCKLTAVFDVWP